MLVNFFEDEVLKNMEKPLNKMYERDCFLDSGIEHYKSYQTDDPEIRMHIDSVISCVGTKREYISICGNKQDSHGELEKTGLCRYMKRYTAILSLEDSLDYILHRITHIPTAVFRSIPNYYDFSRSLLKLNFEALEGMSFESLTSADARMGEYLSTMYIAASKEENAEFNFLNTFLTAISQELSKILEYTSAYYYLKKKKDDPSLVLRSKSLASFVMTSDQKEETQLVLKQSGFEDYTINIKFFEKGEYISRIKEHYA